MSSPSNDIITRFGWELDAASQKRVLKALADFRKATEAGLDDKAVDKFGKRFGKLAREIGLPADAVDKLTNELLAMGGNLDQIEKFGAAFLDVSRNAERAGKEVKELSKIQLKQQAFDDVSRNVGLAGDIQSNLGALNALSGGQLGPVGEVVALVEELPRLKTAIAGLPQTLSSAASAIGPAGVAIGIALGAVALALSDFVARGQQTSQDIQDLFKQQLDLDTRLNQGNISTDQLEQEIADAQGAYDAAADNLADAEQELSGIFQNIQAQTPALGVFSDGFARFTFALNDAVNMGNVDAVQENVRVAQQQLDAAENALQVLTAARGDERLVNEKLADSELKLAATREELIALNRLAADTTERYNNETVRINEDRRIAAIREEEDYNERLADLRQNGAKRLEAIEKAGQARIEAIRKQLSSLPGELSSELAKAEQSAADERRKILGDFAKDAQRDYEDFVRKENEIRRKAQIDRLRLEEDFQDKLNDAAAEGDVESFLRAQREREKALSRQAEDIGEEAKTRADDFTAEQEQRRQDLQQRLNELREGLAKERSEITQNFEQRRTQLVEQLEAERVALKEARDLAIQQQQEVEQQLADDRKKRLDRQREDEQRADAERDRAYQKELDLIQEKTNAAQKALKEELVAAQKLETAARRLATATASIGSATSGKTSSSGSSGSKTGTKSTRKGGGFFTFATGGLALATPGGVPAILAEAGQNELAVPVGNATGQGAAVEAISRLQGSLGGGSRGIGITVHVNDNRTVMVGDIASVSMVEQALAEYDTALTTQIVRGIEAARYSPSAA